MKGIIFDIKHYAIHDGPGIRTTVFFKGCPLNCIWCHNPEGISSIKEVFLRAEKCRHDCRDCLDTCPVQALTKNGAVVKLNREACNGCGICEEVCVYGALEVAGKEMSTEEVIKKIEKDRIFYEESSGGVTFSGGEPLVQIEFLYELLKECGNRGLHRAVDTSGYSEFSNFEKIFPHVDLFLYDLKMINNEKHLYYTGCSNSLILDNLVKLAEKGGNIWIRIPLIKGINDNDEEISSIGRFLEKIVTVNEVQILPYHMGGAGKRKRLQHKEFSQDLEPPSEDRINQIKNNLTNYGLRVKIGG